MANKSGISQAALRDAATLADSRRVNFNLNKNLRKQQAYYLPQAHRNTPADGTVESQIKKIDGGELGSDANVVVNWGLGNSLMKEGIPVTKQDAGYYSRKQLIDDDGGVPGFGKAAVDEEFYEWAKRKEEEAFAYEFRRYIYAQIKLDTPEAREFWSGRFPEWTNRVYEAYENQAEIDKRVKMISVRGVQNEEDLWILYLKDRGMLQTSMDVAEMSGIAGDRSYGYLNQYPRPGIPKANYWEVARDVSNQAKGAVWNGAGKGAKAIELVPGKSVNYGQQAARDIISAPLKNPTTQHDIKYPRN